MFKKTTFRRPNRIRKGTVTPAFTVTALLCIAALSLLAGCSTGDFDSILNPISLSLFVPDVGNNRVLVYDPPFTTGKNASVVLGQGDFGTSTAGTTASTLSVPGAVAVDASRNLYVADKANCRVTQFRPPFTTGMAASLAIGRADL